MKTKILILGIRSTEHFIWLYNQEIHRDGVKKSAMLKYVLGGV